MTRICEFQEAKSVAVCGDIHGKFDELLYRMTRSYDMHDTVVIVAGDCGFGFHKRGYYDQVYNRVLPKLEKANCWVVFVRGNHDNPAYFDGEEICRKRWMAVEDYSLVVTPFGNILCVGGATSVDRCHRESYRPLFHVGKNEGVRRRREIGYTDHRSIEPADWWPTEAPYFFEAPLDYFQRAVTGIDLVVSHVPPSMCEDVMPPTWIDYLVEDDPTLPDDMKRDRETMDALLARLRRDCHPVRHWLYGHYHHSWQADIDGIDYTMLREMEMKELR